jgi:hypothetical protein
VKAGQLKAMNFVAVIVYIIQDTDIATLVKDINAMWILALQVIAVTLNGMERLLVVSISSIGYFCEKSFQIE